MIMTRLKKVTGLALDHGLLDRLEAWRMSQDVPPTKTACMETAIREFLERREVRRGKAVKDETRP
jgi:hypothetical protein